MLQSNKRRGSYRYGQRMKHNEGSIFVTKIIRGRRIKGDYLLTQIYHLSAGNVPLLCLFKFISIETSPDKQRLFLLLYRIFNPPQAAQLDRISPQMSCYRSISTGISSGTYRGPRNMILLDRGWWRKIWSLKTYTQYQDYLYKSCEILV